MLEAIKNRYSCRSFSDKPVEEEKLNEVINAGLYAPSAKNNQNVIIIAIKNKEIRDEYVKLNAKVLGRDMDSFYGAPIVLVVAAKKSHFAIHDGAALLENMLIEAKNQCLDTCWIFRAKEVLEMEECAELFKELNLDLDEYVGVSNVALGYAKEQIIKEKQIKENRVFVIE